MAKTKQIKLIAHFNKLDWKMNVVENTLEGVINYDDFDSQRFMKAMHGGDLSSLSCPLKLDSVNTYSKIFNVANDDELDYADKIETEVVAGGLKFVVRRNYTSVMKWEYLNGERGHKESAN